MLNINKSYPLNRAVQYNLKKHAPNPEASAGSVRSNYLSNNIKAYYPVLPSGMSKISFAGKTYDFKAGKNILTIKIDDDSSLGNEPVFCYGYKGENNKIWEEFALNYGIDKNYTSKWAYSMREMQKVGNTYQIVDLGITDKLYYAVYYQDTKKWDDNNGNGYELDTLSIINKITAYDKKDYKQPLVRVIKRGSTKGKVVAGNNLTEVLEKLSKNNKPVIVVVNDSKLINPVLPLNVRGVIFNGKSSSSLSHEMSQIRDQVDTCVVIQDNEQFKKLTEMNGKFIDLKVNNKGLNWKPIDKVDDIKIVLPKIEIPPIITTDKLLTSAEYKLNLVGPKAYNLHRLEEMKEKGKLKDVMIPKSFAVPCGIFDKVMDANHEIAENINEKIHEIEQLQDSTQNYIHFISLRQLFKNLEIPNEIRDEIIKFKNKCGLRDKVMVRSSFNGEDVKDYSAAGLYDSDFCRDNDDLFSYLKSVWASKWSNRAYWSRRKHNTDHNIIKPTVIIQDRIDADYKFTIYTKDLLDDDKLLIEMSSNKSTIDPYIITYDRKTKHVEVESIERKGRRITLDENFEIIGAEPIDDPISNNKQWKTVLKKVCESALAIEKEFGAPQDIEGGIKLADDGRPENSQIYVWQTRDQ